MADPTPVRAVKDYPRVTRHLCAGCQGNPGYRGYVEWADGTVRFAFIAHTLETVNAAVGADLPVSVVHPCSVTWNT